ncbi:MAG: hypothetical protein R6U25_06945 [Alkalispirochaeta sp.]
MKNSLLHLSWYFIYAALCAVVIVSVMLVMGASLVALGSVAALVLFSAWAVGMVPATLRVLRRGRRPVLVAVGVAGFTAAMLVGTVLLHGTGVAATAESQVVWAMTEGRVETGRIYQGEQYSVLVDAVTGSELRSVVVTDHTETVEQRITTYPEGYWDRFNGELILPDGPEIDLNTLKGFGLPEMPPAVRTTVSDVLRLVETAALLWSAPVPFLSPDSLPPPVQSLLSPVLTVLMLTLLLTAVWTPLRLTRWPLLNVVAGLAYLRLVVALPAVTDQLMRLELVARWLPEMSRAELVMLVGGLVFLVLALLAVLRPSLASWRHNMHFQESGA